MYIQDYDERLPLHYFRDSSSNITGSIITVIHPYIKNVGVWDCPSAARKTSVLSNGDPAPLGEMSYGWNFMIFPLSNPLKLAAIKSPAECVLVADTCADSWGRGRLYYPSYAPGFNTPCSKNDGWPAGCDNSYWDTEAMGGRPGFNFVARHNG
ncbi:MAG TPA: hypothetical protein DEP45_15300, partial [Armatimonadetes bacterium]|nr:hypothetical protein [Armatimonadota bacterium]